MYQLLAGVVLAAVLLGPLQVHAQTSGQTAAPPSDTTQNAALRAFLDCNEQGCDRDFLVTEMVWVNWMRDRLDADFHLLVTSLTTGSGGRQYQVVAIGQRAFAGKTDTLMFTTQPNDADDTIRRALLRSVGQLLLPHAARGALGSRLTIAYSPPDGSTSASAAPANDRWDFWTYSISLNGFLNGESQQTFSEVWNEISANRTTERWKVRVGGNVSYNESKFTLDSGETFTAIRRYAGASALAVRSVNDHWSLGGRLSASRSDFSNTELVSQAAAAAEWNYFPYKDFTRRKFAVLYTLGVRDLRYREVTIYDRTQERRPLHTLDATFGARQPWGEANITLYGSQYLDGLKYYNAGVWGNVEVRLGRGLSFNVDGRLTRVRDQLFLPRGGQTDAEVIARQQALATNYRYFAFFGVRYQFGSIFNSVVNPRFGNISGADDF